MTKLGIQGLEHVYREVKYFRLGKVFILALPTQQQKLSLALLKTSVKGPALNQGRPSRHR